MNTAFQSVLIEKNTNTPPIWFMRQAGRYHKHYQNLRKQHGFMQLCKNPELASQVALGPIQDFDFDLAILFSDLLFPLEALGMGLNYDKGPPELGFNLNESNINKLNSVEQALPHLFFQKEAMTLTRSALPKNKSLIGFVGGPWTLFTYATEGSHSGNLNSAKKLAPKIYEEFLKLIVPLLIENIKLQIDGGAEAVMILDTAAGELSHLDFENYVKKSLEPIAKIHAKQTGYYSKHTTIEQVLSLANLDFRGYGVDHRIWIPELQSQFSKVNKFPFIQGNFDQNLLFLDDDNFKTSVGTYFNKLLTDPRFDRTKLVCGLGHGVLPNTPEKNVKYFVDYAREIFK
jgi:uroporphyrinogen decarboxylase